MKIHYFQRYHQGEDRATSNTMLMLSRLYTYSPDKFFRFLKDQYFADNPFEPEITFNLQEKGEKSRSDATITQESFKIGTDKLPTVDKIAEQLRSKSWT